MKILVTGWFSFEQMGATAGDLLARDLVCDWLAQASIAFDTAVTPPFSGGVDWHAVDPEGYSHIVFVCGPFGNGPPLTEFLERFRHCRLFGLNLSMLQSLEEWNPFDLLLERDSSRCARPDMVFLTRQKQVPAIGVIIVHPQEEYGVRARHQSANAALQRMLDDREVSRVPVDTRLDVNAGGLRTPAEVESLIARMDVIVTTRLHGLVMGIKNDTPVLAIDPIVGGAKVYRQAQTIGWPVVFRADEISDVSLAEAFDYCLGEEARTCARECRRRAESGLSSLRDEFLTALTGGKGP